MSSSKETKTELEPETTPEKPKKSSKPKAEAGTVAEGIMPKYRRKQRPGEPLQAAKVERIESITDEKEHVIGCRLSFAGGGTRELDENFVNAYRPHPSDNGDCGYFVEFPGTGQSWIPTDVFEEGFELVE